MDFLSHVITCCEQPEPALRRYLRNLLSRNGFVIETDRYRSPRACRTPNLRAVRGAPTLGLIAHTDTCREHEEDIRHPRPVVCTRETRRGQRQVIQDRSTSVQLGGDDRLGVAIITWAALAMPDAPLSLLFTTDEEIGLQSAAELPESWTRCLDLLVEVDRGNQAEAQLVTSIGGLRLCSARTERMLLEVARACGHPRVAVEGRLTDVYEIVARGACENAVNMTCGYHDSVWASGREYIDVLEAVETLAYVRAIIDGVSCRAA